MRSPAQFFRNVTSSKNEREELAALLRSAGYESYYIKPYKNLAKLINNQGRKLTKTKYGHTHGNLVQLAEIMKANRQMRLNFNAKKNALTKAHNLYIPGSIKTNDELKNYIRNALIHYNLYNGNNTIFNSTKLSLLLMRNNLARQNYKKMNPGALFEPKSFRNSVVREIYTRNQGRYH